MYFLLYLLTDVSRIGSTDIAKRKGLLCINFVSGDIRNFSKHFLLSLFGGKNSVVNWVSKLNLPVFIISRTHIPFAIVEFYSSYIIHYKTTSKKDIFSVFFSLEVHFLAI